MEVYVNRGGRMRLIVGINLAGLYLLLYSKTENRIYWFDFGFYISSEKFTLVEISTTRKQKERN